MDERAWLEARIAALYGRGIDWARASGVIHVAAIDAHSRRALAVGPGAPASATDRFVLGFARARADAIVTTGAILRAEPALVHRFADAPEAQAYWQRFRADVLGRAEPPTLVVLTASGDWPPAHPALHEAPRTIVLTTAAGRARLGGAEGSDTAARGRGERRETDGTIAAARRIEVFVLDDGPPAAAGDPLARAIDWLRRERGCETIVLESGPRSTLGLYAAARPRIDELLLSVFEGNGAPLVDAPRFPDPSTLAAHFAADLPGGGDSAGRVGAGRVGAGRGAAGRGAEVGRPDLGRSDAGTAQPVSRKRVEEPSGVWLFERYRRRDPAGRIGRDSIGPPAR